MSPLGGTETVPAGQAQLAQFGVKRLPRTRNRSPQLDEADEIVRAVLPVESLEGIVEGLRELARIIPWANRALDLRRLRRSKRRRFALPTAHVQVLQQEQF